MVNPVGCVRNERLRGGPAGVDPRWLARLPPAHHPGGQTPRPWGIHPPWRGRNNR
ncbi:MAG: hypothetical protein ACK5F7_10820 [Planctomycetaceae bacterium]